MKHLKHLKLKQVLLTKFVSKMSDAQIERIKREINRSEAILNRFAFSDSNQLQSSRQLVAERELSFQENSSEGVKECKKRTKILKNETQLSMLKNLRRKKGESSVGVVYPLVNQGGLNVTAMSGNSISTAPVETEKIRIKCEPVCSEEPVIALNIPMNDILGNHFVIENIKSEK